MSEDEPTPEALAFGRRLSKHVLEPMKLAFVGKDEVIDLLGVSLVAGENVFILGPPGTAKSMIVRDLSRRINGQTFEYLLTRFTEPNELFGPFDIRRLREGVLETNTEGMLPEASMVFLDELLNANSAILNSVLTVLNERVLRRGRETIELPLLMVVGASNHLPEEESLQALFDRFLLRVRSDNVADDSLGAVLQAGWRLSADEGKPVEVGINAEDVRAIQKLVVEVDLEPVRESYVGLVGRLRSAGIAVSDRRAVKLQRLIAASAILCGRMSAHATDLWVLRHIWDTEEQHEVLASIVDDAMGQEASGGPEVVVHQRARENEAPNAEHLNAELERLKAELQDGGEDDVKRAIVRDNLGLIAQRSQWLSNDEQRSFLNERVEEVWELLGKE